MQSDHRPHTWQEQFFAFFCLQKQTGILLTFLESNFYDIVCDTSVPSRDWHRAAVTPPRAPAAAAAARRGYSEDISCVVIVSRTYSHNLPMAVQKACGQKASSPKLPCGYIQL